jgi:hypothetical protein
LQAIAIKNRISKNRPKIHPLAAPYNTTQNKKENQLTLIRAMRNSPP